MKTLLLTFFFSLILCFISGCGYKMMLSFKNDSDYKVLVTEIKTGDTALISKGESVSEAFDQTFGIIRVDNIGDKNYMYYSLAGLYANDKTFWCFNPICALWHGGGGHAICNIVVANDNLVYKKGQTIINVKPFDTRQYPIVKIKEE